MVRDEDVERNMEAVEKKMEDVSNPWEHLCSETEKKAICWFSVEKLFDNC
jgi:hypothetical protein